MRALLRSITQCSRGRLWNDLRPIGNQRAASFRRAMRQTFHGFAAAYAAEYAAAAKSLAARGKLRLIRGRVTSVTPATGRPAVSVVIITDGGEQSLEAAVVIDCSGSEPLRGTSVPLLQSMLKHDGLARINAAGMGIEVTPGFEAAHGIFVVGPLLAGHSSATAHIWNLESAPRIDALAKRLARLLV